MRRRSERRRMVGVQYSEGRGRSNLEEEEEEEGRREGWGCWPRYVATLMPVVMKVRTATAPRLERRDKPHTPCPLVHPFPKRVPNPTRRPLMR